MPDSLGGVPDTTFEKRIQKNNNQYKQHNTKEPRMANSEMNNQEKFQLVISADGVTSTDERFTMDKLYLGDNYKPLGVIFRNADGEEIKRKLNKGERRVSCQTLPRIACQIFEKELASLSVEEKEAFPICRYAPSMELIRGIYSGVDEFRRHRNSIEYVVYKYDAGRQFVFYCWNLFSTVIFAQECLKRFGHPGEQFVLTYREKNEKEMNEKKENVPEAEPVQETSGYNNPYSSMLLESKNLIFRGAPGTGKSYLAKEIAADIVSDGYYDDCKSLTDEQRQQVEFVQFHPSYDYSDFVEGLRPCINDDGSMGFELQDGIFKQFINRARKNYENSLKSKEIIEKEVSVQDAMMDFLSGIEFGKDIFKTVSGNEFTITSVDERYINLSIPGNAMVNTLSLNVSEIQQMLEADTKFSKVKDITAFFGKKFATQQYSYNFALYNEILKKKGKRKKVIHQEELKKYVFIIDEINRGEISKIFGELFFAIDPGYRGRDGEVATQYSNLHANPNEKFYIPENVYIIGTMNDIDRSVDSFDFAMRRRFRFVEIKADERLEMLENLEDEALKNEAIQRMTALNQAIIDVEDLNRNYQIGASYFLKLKTLSFDELWTDYLEPLLQEYVRGMYDEEERMIQFAEAYGYSKQNRGEADEMS
ncbi:MAG: AAA family ATPase [Mogibacterium sp.]|nr:AAA family ATPase [Mogibacterium sp.]